MQIIDPTPINVSISQKVQDASATQFGMQGQRSNVTSQIGTLITTVSPVEVTFLLVLAKAYAGEEGEMEEEGMAEERKEERNEETKEETKEEKVSEEEENDHWMELIDVVEEQCSAMLVKQRQREKNQPRVRLPSSSFSTHSGSNSISGDMSGGGDVLMGTLEEISAEIDSDGPLLSSASLLGLTIHFGIDNILFTLLVAPKGISVSRPCVRATLSNVRLDGNNKSLDRPFATEGGLTLHMQHYNANHSFWQPMLETISFYSKINIPLLSMDVEDVLQTKILFTSSNVLQVNVTVPLLQDLIVLGSYSDNLDRDGDGDLDVEDLARMANNR